MNPLGLPLDPILYDGEIDVDGSHVVEVPEPCLHGCEVVTVSVGLHNLRLFDRDGGLGLVIDVSFLISLPSDADLDVPAIRTVGVQFDDTACSIVGGDPHIVHDLLHPAVGIAPRRKEVVE